MVDTVKRFDNRVESYVRSRPHYPYAVLACLVEEYGLGPISIVADVGAGTGLLTRLLLIAGCTVQAVEPNERMRLAAAALLGGHPGYHSVAGTAEATSLPARSVDFVTAGQAFHWFDPPTARQEFQRILRPGGRVALVWNARREQGSPFLDGYQAIIARFGLDYTQVDHARVVDATTLAGFFGAAGYREHAFVNLQALDLLAVIDRLSSTSYMPAPDHPTYPAMVAAIETLFAAAAQHDRVIMEYDAKLYVGRL
ncbi:MAG TPA: class I SAM-dependent methyltransferase [Caldilinea sp.]|nr:class I SAM-dependent methyltransferase [Anaerolineales bacterium]HRA65223.1 class I SAM-dependent methyltransferase [Caldilinea sp.]